MAVTSNGVAGGSNGTAVGSNGVAVGSNDTAVGLTRVVLKKNSAMSGDNYGAFQRTILRSWLNKNSAISGDNCYALFCGAGLNVFYDNFYI